MALSRFQFKQLFRQVFKVKQGGPTDVTRAQPVIGVLDQMVEDFALKSEIPTQDQFTPITENQYGTHEAAPTLDSALAYLYAQIANGTAVTIPAKPTGALVDDTGNTFSVLLVPGFDALTEYQGFGFPGLAGTQPLTTANAYLAAGRVYLKNLTGPIEIGAVGIGVAASGNRPAGPFTTNGQPFTGPVVLPEPTITSFTPASAAAGAQITITGTNFTGATAVLFGTTPAASFTVLNATTVIAAVPTGAPAGPLRLSVTTSSGTGVSLVDFTVAGLPQPAATVWSFNAQTRILSQAGPAGYESAQLEYKQGNGAYQDYTAGLSIDGLAHAPGEWQGRVKASSTNQAGQVGSSPSISSSDPSIGFPAKIHVGGDSISAGAVATSWVEFEKSLLDNTKYPTASYNNIAVSGESSNMQLNRLQSQIIAAKGTGNGFAQDIAVLYVGVNDLRLGESYMPHAGTYRTKDEIAHDILEWGRRARLAGFKPILVTIGPDRRKHLTDPAEDSRLVSLMISVNNITTANAAKYGFMGVVDNSSDAFIGAPSAPINYAGSYWTNDLIHPAAMGTQYLAGRIKPVIEVVAATPLGTFTDPGQYVASAGNENTGSGYTPYALVFPQFGEVANATISGNSIRGTGAADGNEAQFWGSATSNNKAGATTNQIIAYVEYIVNEANKESLFGWNNNNTSTAYQDLLFAWHLKTQAFAAENPGGGTEFGIRPFGYGHSSIPNANSPDGFIAYQPGDVLRVTLEKTRVVWYQNGIERFVVNQAPPADMFVDMALVPGGTVNDIRVGAANWVARDATPTPPSSSAVRQAAVWKPNSTVAVSGNSWTKAAGAVGTFDAGTTNTVAMGPSSATVRGSIDFLAKTGAEAVLIGLHAGTDTAQDHEQLIGTGSVCVQIAETDGLRWFVNGVVSPFIPWANNDRIKIEVLQTQIVIYQNNTEKGRVTYTLPDNAYIDSSATKMGYGPTDVYILAANPVAV